MGGLGVVVSVRPAGAGVPSEKNDGLVSLVDRTERASLSFINHERSNALLLVISRILLKAPYESAINLLL